MSECEKTFRKDISKGVLCKVGVTEISYDLMNKADFYPDFAVDAGGGDYRATRNKKFLDILPVQIPNQFVMKLNDFDDRASKVERHCRQSFPIIGKTKKEKNISSYKQRQCVAGVKSFLGKIRSFARIRRTKYSRISPFA